jgi:dihydrofolate synthase/folylpolyglutamate synthase
MERNPTLMLDGGHNPAAGAVVADFLAHYRERYRGVRIILVLGCMRDKDRAGLFKVLAPAVDEVVVTQVRMPRAATVEEMCVALQDWSGPVHTTINAAEALACARRLAGSDDLICVTGSLMLVGEIKALLRGCEVSGLRG